MDQTTRREFGKAAITSMLPSLAHPATRKRPNVLFVLADEWRHQAMGYAGDTNVHTPAFDRFAQESIQVDNAISGCPVCSPYRASLMTGQYPLTNGVYINDVPLAPKGVTLAEAFRKVGYSTGYIGKWHLYGSPDGHFGRRLSYIPPEKRFGFDYWKACECTHEYNHSLYYQGNDPTPKYWPGYDAFAQTADACRFIKDKAATHSPYLLFLSLGPPHFPVDTAPAKYQDLYRDRDINLRPNVPEDKKKEALTFLRGYYAHIAALNDCFQQLLDTLESTKTAEETVVVFTSDHGEMAYSQGLTTKLYPWEESLRVPMLIRYPREFGRQNRRSPALVNAPDIMPTLLGLSGIEVPKGVQGFDYSRSFRSDQKNLPSSAFINLPAPFGEARHYGFAEYRGVRTERYTYVRSIHGPWLLYDNQTDPYQMRNLCGRPEASSIQAHLESEIDAWRQRLDDRFLPGSEYLQRDGLAQYGPANLPVGNARSPWGDWKATLDSKVQRN